MLHRFLNECILQSMSLVKLTSLKYDIVDIVELIVYTLITLLNMSVYRKMLNLSGLDEI